MDGIFPNLLARILPDNILYAKSVKLMGDRVNAAKIDFSQILSDKVEAELKEAAMISTGTEVNDPDLMDIMNLCDQVLSLSELKARLYDYLKSRMNKIAPNLTAIVGELVGARLIANAGSLANLAALPGGTIQILGAQRRNHSTPPKRGIIYHASLIAQASSLKTKGSISRSLAAKTALAIRYDVHGDCSDNSMGLKCRAKLEARLRDLEGRGLIKSVGSAMGKLNIEVDDKDVREVSARGLINPAKVYNPAADSTLGQALDAAATANEENSSEMEEQTPAVERLVNSFGGVLLRWPYL